MYLGATTIDLTPWADQATMPVPTQGMAVTCPGAPGCPGGSASDLLYQMATSQDCTCQPDGTCRENGNSCVPAGPNSPVAPKSTQLISGVSNSTLLLIGAGVVGLVMLGGRRR